VKKAPTHCRNCNGRLEEGHVLDEGYGARFAARWQPGTPKKSWIGGVKADKKSLLEIRSFRCEKCGLLENYAL
jgi:hypothetical protein